MSLDSTAKRLGEGKRIELENGEVVFKLDSFSANPVVKPQDLGLTWQEKGKLKIGAVFNGGAEIFQNGIILTPRCHKGYRKSKYFDRKQGVHRYRLHDYISEIWPLESEDGVHFKRFHEVMIKGDGSDHKDFIYGIEDIRIIKHDRTYLLVGCGKRIPPFKGLGGDRTAIYSTKDFVRIDYHGIIEFFDSRNLIPFPESVNGKLYIVWTSRAKGDPNIHLDFLRMGMDQLLHPSKYPKYWKKIHSRRSKNLLLKAGTFSHEREKIGSGTQLIKTDEGWLFIYHGVGLINSEICKYYGLHQKIERGYSICAALLDLDDPRRVICRTRNPIFIPSAPYEFKGDAKYPIDVPGVVFPTGAVIVKDKLLIYCGVGDKYVSLLGCDLHNLIDYLIDHCKSD